MMLSLLLDFAADESSVANGGEFPGDRESQASSLELCEVAYTPLTPETDDRESCHTEDDEPDPPVKPSLR